MLTITAPPGTEEPVPPQPGGTGVEREARKRVVLVLARQHPGESPASYVVQGLMDFLVSKHKIAEELREKLVFKVCRNLST